MFKNFLILLFIFSLPVFLHSEDKWLAKDKVLHFSGSTFLTLWNYEVSDYHLKMDHENCLYFSVSLTSLIGFSKECSDKTIKKSYWSWKDITANTLGIVTGVIIIESMR